MTDAMFLPGLYSEFYAERNRSVGSSRVNGCFSNYVILLYSRISVEGLFHNDDSIGNLNVAHSLSITLSDETR